MWEIIDKLDEISAWNCSGDRKITVNTETWLREWPDWPLNVPCSMFQSKEVIEVQVRGWVTGGRVGRGAI